MTSIIDDSATAMFLVGSCVGLVVMTAVLTMRSLAAALLVGLAIAIVGVIATDGLSGFMRWVGYGIGRLIAAGPFVTGLGVGKLLSGVLVVMLQPTPRGRRR